MSAAWKAFATVDPFEGMNEAAPGVAENLVGGEWSPGTEIRNDLVDPLNGGAFVAVPDTTDIAPFIAGLASCSKSGLHNPLKNTDRYVHLGRVCARSAALMATPAVEEYFVKLTQRVMPKSWQQCVNEVVVTRVFLENFAGDGVRFLGRGFSNPGDHAGQESRGYRWPFGPVVVVAPFNFPLEIPALQAMGALFMGNRPLVKIDSKVSVVFEQFLRMLIHCGLSPNDIDLIHCRGEKMGELISSAAETIRLVQQELNPRLVISGILLTMFDGRNNLCHQVSDEIRAHFGDKVFDVVVPRNVRLSEAPSYGQPALLYDIASRGAQAYMALAKEVLAGGVHG